MGYDQTACLAEAQGFATEEHSHNRYNRRILSKEAKIPIRTTKTKKILKPTCSECYENFTGARAWLIRNLATRTNWFGFLMQKL